MAPDAAPLSPLLVQSLPFLFQSVGYVDGQYRSFRDASIGGDRTPTPSEIAEIHRLIRVTLTERPGGGAEGVRILYGGSVGPKNAAAIFAAEAVDGALKYHRRTGKLFGAL